MGISIEIKFQLSFIIFPKVVDYDTSTMLFKERELQSTTKKEINNTFFFGHLKHSYEMTCDLSKQEIDSPAEEELLHLNMETTALWSLGFSPNHLENPAPSCSILDLFSRSQPYRKIES